MSSKPESQFIRTVHKHFKTIGLPPYWEKNWNAYRSGTPDVYYSGMNTDLWVEYKFVRRLPVHAPLVADLSPLQGLWLRRRYEEGRWVAVIIGVGEPKGGLVLTDLDWEGPVARPYRLRSHMELAKWIATVTGPGKT